MNVPEGIFILSGSFLSNLPSSSYIAGLSHVTFFLDERLIFTIIAEKIPSFWIIAPPLPLSPLPLCCH